MIIYNIDNKQGVAPIYYINDIAPFKGEIAGKVGDDEGQVYDSIYESVQYINKAEWIADMDILGIEHEEEV